MPSSTMLRTDARILVVDDSQTNVKLLESLLKRHGYSNVTGITDPRWIAPLLDEQLPDLILLDICMPHLSGHDVLRWLKDKWAEESPPVIVLTAQTDRETREQALDLGARDFLTKPFDQQEVMQRIRNTLAMHFLLKERNDRAALLQNLVEERTALIQHLSLEDPVTQLPNRRALLSQLNVLLQEGHPTVVFFLALEGVDDIARLHGFAVSEALSLRLRDRMLEYFAPQVTLGIWNSTEWIMISRQPMAVGALNEQARIILHCIAQPFTVDQVQLRLGTRIGISHTDMPHQSAEHLLRLAALALPEERSGWRLYESSIEENLQKRACQRLALRTALENREMFLVYQPKIELDSGRVIGAEALLRWIHPEMGFVSPADFIPLAEASGDILAIGDWVIDSAIHQLEEWFAAGRIPPDFRLAVNVAPLQLTQQGFARTLLTRLLRSRLPVGALEIEITETGLMENLDLAREQLRLLATHRVSVAIDDFGTGHSSLAYLKTLPVSVLKIDRAFVSNMDSNLQDRRLAETVIAMARNFACHTVAEGVENPEQADLLKAMGCELAQGYWYSPPIKAEQFVEFCAQRGPGIAEQATENLPQAI